MGYKINLVDAKTSTNKNVKEDDLKIKIGVDGDDTHSNVTGNTSQSECREGRDGDDTHFKYYRKYLPKRRP